MRNKKIIHAKLDVICTLSKDLRTTKFRSQFYMFLLDQYLLQLYISSRTMTYRAGHELS